jgi:hypothetical protein
MQPDRLQPRNAAYTCWLAVLVGLLALASATGWAQEPVNKPTPVPNAQIRLPAPASVSARQLADGRIEVNWAPVSGATKYDLWRSVPPDPQTVISMPDAPGTTYVDSDVKVGSYYYYVIAAVSSTGTSGLRAGSVPVKAIASATTSTLRTSDPTTGTTDTSTGTGISSGSLAQKCVQTGAYFTCVSDVVDYSPLIEPAKNVTVTCPQAGQVATGGGFSGHLLNMSVVQSVPVLPTEKTRAGWTVTVTPIRIPNVNAGQVLLESLTSIRRDFQVWAVCGPAGAAAVP